MKTLNNIIEHIWYGRVARYWPAVILLWPLSLLFRALAASRQFFLIRQQKKLPIPIIVVGNISVGGTGKTPLLCALAEALTQRGVRVGIISRGYGGTHHGEPRTVSPQDDAQEVGDEPLLLARTTQCSVVIAHKRWAAAQYLIAHHAVDVLLSDDGLQHYALPREVEIAVLDGQRGVGNGFLLPAGPLREPASRLRSVDFVVINGELSPAQQNNLPSNVNGSVFKLLPQSWVSVKTGEVLPLDAMKTNIGVRAVAGIGNPERFFSTVRQLGFSVEQKAFPDHHIFLANELSFGDEMPVLMTEKDAVKCATFAQEHWYALRVAMALPDTWVDAVWKAAQQKHKKVK